MFCPDPPVEEVPWLSPEISSPLRSGVPGVSGRAAGQARGPSVDPDVVEISSAESDILETYVGNSSVAARNHMGVPTAIVLCTTVVYG